MIIIMGGILGLLLGVIYLQYERIKGYKEMKAIDKELIESYINLNKINDRLIKIYQETISNITDAIEMIKEK